MFWILLTLIILSILYIYINSSVQKKKMLSAIPGPKGIPILGNIFDIKPEPKASLDQLFKISQQYDGIFKMDLGPLGTTVLISDPKYLETILSSPIHINKGGWYHLLRGWIGEGIALVNGTKWKNARKILSPVFSTKVLEDFCKKMDERNREFVDELKKKSGTVLDVTDLMNVNSYLILMRTLIGDGIDEGTCKTYIENVKIILNIQMARLFSLKVFDNVFMFCKDYQKAQRSIKTIRKIISDFINKKRIRRRSELQKSNDKKSFLDLLLDLQEEQADITDSDIIQHVDTFMFAGHDTLSSTLSLAIYELSGNRHLQEKILNESAELFGVETSAELTLKGLESAEFLNLFCKEVLRKYPAAPMIGRITRDPLKLGNYDIPIGTNILILVYCMQRTPKYFPDPLKFDPERFASKNWSPRSECDLATFSHGPRNCLGRRYALMEMKSVITMLVRHFIFSKPDDGFEVSLGTAASLVALNGVLVKIEERI